jgi:hypothetical protein
MDASQQGNSAEGNDSVYQKVSMEPAGVALFTHGHWSLLLGSMGKASRAFAGWASTQHHFR